MVWTATNRDLDFYYLNLSVEFTILATTDDIMEIARQRHVEEHLDLALHHMLQMDPHPHVPLFGIILKNMSRHGQKLWVTLLI